MNATIAYLAPEIPALSAPFVYREILALRNKGFDVLPVSIHPPTEQADEDTVLSLAETVKLYNMGIFSFLIAAVICKFRHPIRYIRTALMLLDDMIHVGFFTKRSATLAFHFLIATRLSLIMERHCCRHLHAHFADAPTDIAMYAARLADISFSFTARSSDLFKEEALIIRKVARSAKAITISNYNRNLMITQGADGDKIVVIHSGVDCLRFGSRESRKERSGSMPLLIGSIGRLIEKKGFGTLIQAANLLVREGMKFRIEIVGEGPWKAKLEQLIRYAGVFDRITFIGSMPNNLVPAWLAKLDIFVLACRIDSNGDMDSIPMPLIEAMAASVPVVSTNISAIPELIENGVSGLLARSEDPSSLSEAIWSILDDTDLQYRCINAACQKVKKDFSEDTNVEKLACLFKEIILPYRFDLQDSQIDCNKTL